MGTYGPRATAEAPLRLTQTGSRRSELYGRRLGRPLSAAQLGLVQTLLPELAVPSGPIDLASLFPRSRAFALLLNETDVRDYSRVRIEWGVDAFPSGASYEKGVGAKAVMVYVFFGKERHASGSLFIPDSPYFLALYLCETESTNEPFKGRYYHASGRFICVDRPPLGATVTTDFPIADTFRRIFGKEAPDISGIGLGIDTANAKGAGIAKSFVRKIEFPE